MQATSGFGFSPFLLLSTLLHGIGALALAVLSALPSPSARGEWLKPGPVHVRIQDYASRVAVQEESGGVDRPAPSAPFRVDGTGEAQKIASQPKAGNAPVAPPPPTTVSLVPREPVGPPLVPAVDHDPAANPASIPHVKRITAVEAWPKGGGRPYPSSDPAHPLRAYSERTGDRNKAARGEPSRPVVTRRTVKKVNVPERNAARPLRMASVNLPASPFKAAGETQAISPPAKEGENTPSAPPRDLLASVQVEDFVRLKPEPDRQPSKPQSATALLSSVNVKMPPLVSATQKANPGPRRKARLAPLLTQDLRYRGYQYAIWKRIDERLYYPEPATAEKIRARVVVRFEVTRDGQLATLRLVKSSGYELFDEEALMAVRKAAPFPKFPATMTAKRLAIRSEILYEP